MKNVHCHIRVIVGRRKALHGVLMNLRKLYYEPPNCLGDQRDTFRLTKPHITNQLPPSRTGRQLFVLKSVLIEER